MDKVPFPFDGSESTYLKSWAHTPVEMQLNYVIYALISAVIYGSINFIFGDPFFKKYSKTYITLDQERKDVWVNK